MTHEHTYIRDHPPMPTGRYLTRREEKTLHLPSAGSLPSNTFAISEERGHCTGCGDEVTNLCFLDVDKFKLYRRRPMMPA